MVSLPQTKPTEKDTMPKFAIQAPAEYVRNVAVALFGRISPLDDLPLFHQIATEIIDAYNENHRDYHGIDHPAHMLAQLDECLRKYPELAEKIDLELMQLLILEHDVVVKLCTTNRPRGWNEEQSVVVAMNHLERLCATKPYYGLITIGITASIDHRMTEQELRDLNHTHQRTIRLFLDLDLAGLGQDPDDFAKDTERNWREWRAVATRAEFNTGRAMWAAKFLMRTCIYHTTYFEDREDQARLNLEALAGVT